MAQNIQVAVRVRPFNEREKQLNAVCCVDMEGPTTTIKDLDGDQPPRSFAFDYSFWSHDGFHDEDGLSVPDGDKYSDQKKVYELLGNSVIENAWNGFHCCLFAFGQTGAGKSYSMIGFGKNKGIVPITCEEIFRRIRHSEDPELKFEVSVSMVEIYNEAVQDLLVHPSKRPKGGLEVRENKEAGVFVDGLSKRPVESYEAVQAVMEEGTSNRTIGSTLMNATSSRAHTVIMIELRQGMITKANNGQSVMKTIKFSQINLVDLAGSEKATQTGATGDRLKEGCAINKSLSALGNVISALADRASGKTNHVIPYRDSKLTRLLQSALGGNSRTIMICAVSPASSNYEETLSTLRYAERAKKIKNEAKVNDDPQETLVKQLVEENKRLRSGSVLAEESKATIKALEAQLAEYQKSWDQKLKEAGSLIKAPEVDQSLPHFANLNEDPVLNCKLLFAFPEGENVVGKIGSGDAPLVPLYGLGCFENHAVISNASANVSIKCNKQAYINGDLVDESGTVNLKHGDRLIFGQNHVFIFIEPNVGSRESLTEGADSVTFSSAKKEFAEKQGDVSVKSEAEIKAEKAKQAEIEMKLNEAEEARQKLEAEKVAQEEAYRKKMAQLADQSEAEKNAMMVKMQDEMKRAEQKMLEAERRQRELIDQENDRKTKESEAKILDEQLMLVLPMCKEATLIAKEIGKPYELKVKLHVKALNGKRRKTDVVVQVEYDGKHVYDWSIETLENRVFLMRELFEKYCEDPASVSTVSEETDPFWDPIQTQRFVGSARILLESLTMQLENEVDAKIMSEEGKAVGILHCEIWPLSSAGEQIIPDNEIVEEPGMLIGKSMKFKVKVTKASGLPGGLAEDVRLEYRFYTDEETYKVPACVGHHTDPAWNYEKVFDIDVVTERFLNYLKDEAITFNLFAESQEAKEVVQKSPVGRSPTSPAVKAVPVVKQVAESIPAPVEEQPKKKSLFCTIS